MKVSLKLKNFKSRGSPSLFHLPRRYVFSQMGFDNFYETEVLMNINDGVYSVPVASFKK